MKLFHFPLLALEEIMREMSYLELFLLSLCSTKTTQLIRSFRWDFKSVTYNSIGKTVSIRGKNSKEEDIFWLKMKAIPSSELENFNSFETRISGINMVCCMPTNTNPFTILFDKTTGKSIIKGIQDHITTLFGRTHLESTVDVYISDKLCCLPKIENFKHSVLKGKHMEASELNALFDDSPESETCHIIPIIHGELVKNSKFYDTKYVKLQNSDWFASDILLHFNGQFLISRQSKINDIAVIRFLMKWKSNQEFQNLEAIRFTLVEDFHLNEDKILKEFDILRWDPSKRPDVYRFSQEITRFSGGLETNPTFDEDTLIRREIDGKLATVRISPTLFTFSVWN